MKRTSLTQGKHREANKHMHLFGKMFKILHFKCQKSKVQNMRERKGERKSTFGHFESHPVGPKIESPLLERKKDTDLFFPLNYLFV